MRAAYTDVFSLKLPCLKKVHISQLRKKIVLEFG